MGIFGGPFCREVWGLSVPHQDTMATGRIVLCVLLAFSFMAYKAWSYSFCIHVRVCRCHHWYISCSDVTLPEGGKLFFSRAESRRARKLSLRNVGLLRAPDLAIGKSSDITAYWPNLQVRTVYHNFFILRLMSKV